MTAIWIAITLTNIAIAIQMYLHWRLAREVRDGQLFTGGVIIASLTRRPEGDRVELERLYKDE